MARNYAALPHEYLEEMDILSDAEFGRLCRALLQYSMDGKEGQLEGAEKVLWKRVKRQEDRFKESYKEQTQSRRSAGKKGAEKRWRVMADDSTAIANDSTAITVIAYDSKNGYTETKTETNTETKTETNIPPPIGGRDTAPARAKTDHPTLEQVQEVAKLRGCPECAKPFFDYYAAAGWRDSEGKPCAWNWQQKLVLWQQREDNRRKNSAARPVKGPLTDIGKPDPEAAREDMARMEKYLTELRKEGDG